MWISVKSYLSLQRYSAHLPADGGLEVPAGSRVADVLEILQVPPALHAHMLLFVNGRPSRPDRALVERDALVFFEPMAGG